jgi:ComF family protein
VSDAPLCATCWALVPRADLVLCVRCLVHERDPVGCTRHAGFRAGVAWVYDERAAAVVAAYKYGARDDLAEVLAPELAKAPRPLPRPDLVAAVPLHAARRRERGYDQAARLARAWARQAGLPFLDGALERVRPTRIQAHLGARERRANVAGAFRVRVPSALKGRKVVLVDDVVTTGATLESALATVGACGAEAAGLALAWAQ